MGISHVEAHYHTSTTLSFVYGAEAMPPIQVMVPVSTIGARKKEEAAK